METIHEKQYTGRCNPKTVEIQYHNKVEPLKLSGSQRIKSGSTERIIRSYEAEKVSRIEETSTGAHRRIAKMRKNIGYQNN